jgi:hypothetical protein
MLDSGANAGAGARLAAKLSLGTGKRLIERSKDEQRAVVAAGLKWVLGDPRDPEAPKRPRAGPKTPTSDFAQWFDEQSVEEKIRIHKVTALWWRAYREERDG